VSLAPWHVLARAEVTKTLAHGDRYLETRVFLADGRIMEQVNPGQPDLENDWREVGRYKDLRATLRQMRRDGWAIRPQAQGSLRGRAVLLAFAVAILAPAFVYMALTTR
jgi:hypothetical protein